MVIPFMVEFTHCAIALSRFELHASRGCATKTGHLPAGRIHNITTFSFLRVAVRRHLSRSGKLLVGSHVRAVLLTAISSLTPAHE
ncbi:hypothetical protein Poly21_28520 [Allorhodopirellula heiligendammensis]|uniref:Uncharacterized protein n=1 Tax=Allorhodopirellula heiligendammensis TaxID=2714739 RepID=A0A5C6BUF6_9BACT|nr:hypothetical protein Poly21_28520 [Allorhodopirellula heiligendammensis]